MNPKELDWVPHTVLREGRRVWSRPRYWKQRFLARQGFHRYGHRYRQQCLFVAGLPKSGTSWLESMLASYPGYHPVMIPEAIDWEIHHGGSHNLPLPRNTFDRLRSSLAVLKLHLPGIRFNTKQLHERALNYVILLRDLRDVAVSHYFYVSRSPWHPEHPDYSDLTVEEGLLHFMNTLLDPYVRWIRSWEKNRDPALSLVITYEQMLANTEKVFGTVADHFGLDASVDSVRAVVRTHAFEQRSGREQGEEDQTSFLRKGIAGDWKNHFTDKIQRRFDQQAGNLLRDYGYLDGELRQRKCTWEE